MTIQFTTKHEWDKGTSRIGWRTSYDGKLRNRVLLPSLPPSSKKTKIGKSMILNASSSDRPYTMGKKEDIKQEDEGWVLTQTPKRHIDLPNTMKVHKVFTSDNLQEAAKSPVPGQKTKPPRSIVVTGDSKFEIYSILVSKILLGKVRCKVKWMGYNDATGSGRARGYSRGDGGIRFTCLLLRKRKSNNKSEPLSPTQSPSPTEKRSTAPRRIHSYKAISIYHCKNNPQ
ncbi:hypothetical protein MFRU_013g01790 [Monilinia fructicola]|nr:hypothetical protein MFRU_013g01790 [Monilinia fructicola]